MTVDPSQTPAAAAADLTRQPWPDLLWIVRHGESAGNVARDAAEAAGHPVIELPGRDVDVPLSDLGVQQAEALGRWFAAQPGEHRPTVLLTSPYLRARHTAELIRERLPADAPELVMDERLREKEFGILDGLTKTGIRARQPDQAEFRRLLGKFYHRPPGGESWCDVIFRLRSVVDTITRDYRRERVLVVAHQVIVLCFRYLLEKMSEEEILAVDRAAEVANCSVTTYAWSPGEGLHGGLVLQGFNFVAPLEAQGTPVTAEPDANVAAR